MSGSQKFIKNLISSGNVLNVAQNTPKKYNSAQKQYLADRTNTFVDNRAYLSSDYVKADIQGLTNSFYNYTTTKIRLADIVRPAASATKKTDDYKQVLLSDKGLSYLPIGAKIKTMGSYWLVVNPANILSVNANAVVARCNATYNSYDYYGNIIAEPIVVEKTAMLGNDNENPINMVLMDGYFNITCQLNKNTVRLGQNKRIMLGNNSYHITGFTDFIQEFSEDVYAGEKNNLPTFNLDVDTGALTVTYPENYDGATYKMIGAYLYEKNSEGLVYMDENGAIYGKEKERYLTHLITFTARIDEVNDNDNTIDRVAEGNNYIVGAILNGQTELIAGQMAQLSPVFTINGQAVESSLTYPLTWSYSSNNQAVASVSETGEVIAYAEGVVTIKATLNENPNVCATLQINVSMTSAEPYVAFENVNNTDIAQFTNQTFTAFYYENNYKTQYPVTWTFGGAKKSDYNAVIQNDNSVSVECISASDTPLTITATCNGKSASITVNLLGY